MGRPKKNVEAKAKTNALRDRIVKNSTITETSILKDSILFNEKDMIHVGIPALDIAMSADVDGGFTPGLTVVAGPSKHFKSNLLLLMTSAFLRKYPNGIILFYDSEFGSPSSYFESFNIPSESVVHSPIMNIEELKFDIVAQLEELQRGDEIMIIVDSIGSLASKKEAKDAKEQNEAADLTRAKELKSLFRIITPYLTMKNIPMIVINHTYKTLEKYGKTVVSGGSGPYLSADTIWVIGREQDAVKKDNKTVLKGFKFSIKVEKSRFVKEKSVIPLSVTFENGINRWSGLLDMALESGHVTAAGKGKYNFLDPINDELSDDFSETELMENDVLWEAIITNPVFKDWVKDKYKLINSKKEEE